MQHFAEFGPLIVGQFYFGFCHFLVPFFQGKKAAAFPSGLPFWGVGVVPLVPLIGVFALVGVVVPPAPFLAAWDGYYNSMRLVSRQCNSPRRLPLKSEKSRFHAVPRVFLAFLHCLISRQSKIFRKRSET